MRMKYVWLVLQFKGESTEGLRKFEHQGVFSSKELAIIGCRTDQFCVLRMTLDEELPVETIENKNQWYPLLEAEPVFVD